MPGKGKKMILPHTRRWLWLVLTDLDESKTCCPILLLLNRHPVTDLPSPGQMSLAASSVAVYPSYKEQRPGAYSQNGYVRMPPEGWTKARVIDIRQHPVHNRKPYFMDNLIEFLYHHYVTVLRDSLWMLWLFKWNMGVIRLSHNCLPFGIRGKSTRRPEIVVAIPV